MATETDSTVRVLIDSDADIVTARQEARALAQKAGFDGTDVALIAIATSEAAGNIIRNSKRGEILVSIVHHRGGERMEPPDHPPLCDGRGGSISRRRENAAEGTCPLPARTAHDPRSCSSARELPLVLGDQLQAVVRRRRRRRERRPEVPVRAQRPRRLPTLDLERRDHRDDRLERQLERRDPLQGRRALLQHDRPRHGARAPPAQSQHHRLEWRLDLRQLLHRCRAHCLALLRRES